MSQVALLKQCSSPQRLQAGGGSYPKVGTRYWQPFARDPIVEDIGRDSQRQRRGCRMHMLGACADDQWNGPRQSLDPALYGCSWGLLLKRNKWGCSQTDNTYIA